MTLIKIDKETDKEKILYDDKIYVIGKNDNRYDFSFGDGYNMIFDKSELIQLYKYFFENEVI